MKKKGKGRVIGTIGWLLGVILGLGVIGYSTYLGVNGFMGVMTGNAIIARISEDERAVGDRNTKQLIKEATDGIIAPTENFTFNSYTMNFEFSQYENTAENKASSSAKGIVYVNNDYTYMKVTVEGVAQQEYQTAYTEVVFVKATAKTYFRTNAVATNAEDSLLLNNSAWSEDEPAGNGAAMAMAALQVFAPVAQDNGSTLFNMITGEYVLDTTIDNATAEYGFTVGYRPNLYAKVYTADESMVSTCALTFSKLNNTKITLPKALQDAITEVNA